jgi:hypothetical protein
MRGCLGRDAEDQFGASVVEFGDVSGRWFRVLEQLFGGRINACACLVSRVEEFTGIILSDLSRSGELSTLGAGVCGTE